MKKDLNAYQLSAYIQERLGLHEGLVSRLHQAYMNLGEEETTDYLSELKVLSYDMLYGEQYCWNGENPYEPTEITFGYAKPVITGLHPVFDSAGSCYLTVYGENFTEYSQIYLNNTRYRDTIYVSEHELFLPKITLDDGDSVSVGIYNDNNLYTESDGFIYTAKDYQ